MNTAPFSNAPHPSKPIPVSPFQNHMISECLSSPTGSGVYVEQIIIDIEQPIDFDRFSRTWLRIIQHHKTLRLGFSQRGPNQLEQYIFTLEELNIEQNDWSRKSRQAANEFLNMFIQADRRLGFSPFSPPLFRIALLKLEESRYTVVFSFFSAIVDKEELILILKDLFSAYGRAQYKLSQPISPSQSHPETQHSKVPAQAFWERLFKSVREPVIFPFISSDPKPIHKDQRKRKDASLTTQRQTCVISMDQTRRLSTFCKKYNTDLKFLLMGAFAIILSHYSQKNEIVLCIQLESEKISLNPESENRANMLPAKFFIDPEEKLSQFLHGVHKSWHETEAFKQADLSDIRTRFRGQGDADLLDIAFSFQRQCLASKIAPYIAEISCKRISILNRTPFSLFLDICGTDTLSVTLQYDRRRFDEKAIKGILNHLTCLLDNVAENLNPTLSEIPILTDQEKNKIAQQLNPYPIPQRPDSCLHHLFEIQASANRYSIALSTDSVQMTYGELNDRANQIAHYLIHLGATPGCRLMLILESSLTLIPMQLGALKAGCIVMPVSADKMSQDLGQLCETLLPDMVITSKKWSARLPISEEKIFLTEPSEKEINRLPKTPPGITVSPDNVAYIIPVLDDAKIPIGIMLAHYSLVSYTRSAIDIYDVLPTDRILITKAVGTTTSTTQIYLGLLSGAMLTMGPWDSQPPPLTLMDFCRTKGVTILDLHKSLWLRLTKEQSLPIPDTVKLFVINDIRQEAETLEQWKKSIPATVRTISTYGSAQTTGPAFWSDQSENIDRTPDQVSLGNPFPGVCLTLVNRFRQPALPNTTGELYLGGVQVAIAYFNNPKKTREHFQEIDFLGHSVCFFKTGTYATHTPESGLIYHSKLVSQDSTQRPKRIGAIEKSIQPPIILIGNSVQAAQSYKKATRSGPPFFHAPIFVHFYDAEGQNSLNLDIPNIAAKCINDIRKSYPEGPYILIGECQNAVVAHEAAIQSKRMGIDISLLIVIDENWQAQKVTPSLSAEQNFFQKQRAEIKAHGIGHLFSKLNKRMHHEWFKVYSSFDGIREKLCNRLGLPVPETIQHRTMEKVYYQACEKHPYSPPPYDGRVLLLYSKDWERKFRPQLSQYYTGEIRKASLPIAHSHWFRPEQVQFILKEIRHYA